MKKYLCLGLALLAMSCSSDDEKEDPPIPTPQPTTQYEVDLMLTSEEIDQFPQGVYPTRLVVFNKSDNEPLGNMGLLMFSDNVNFRDYKVYDLCCPRHWENDKHELSIVKQNSRLALVSCKKDGILFNLVYGTQVAWAEGEERFSLVSYQVERTPKEHIYPEKSIHISNPNYKSTIK